MVEALLVLEDGRCFRGAGHGALAGSAGGFAHGGEVVFNTSMTGYQEIFTDPSYSGQMVCLTNPQIGNYGATAEDDQAAKPYIEGLIVREFSAVASNWRSEEECQAYLHRHGIAVLSEIDTRALVRHLRDHGAQRGILGTGAGAKVEALQAKARALPRMDGLDLARVVTTGVAYPWREPVGQGRRQQHGQAAVRVFTGAGREFEPQTFRVTAYDFGIKRNILRQLAAHGCDVTVVPATTPAEDVLAMKPDGVFLSNGPGDPEPCTYAQENIRRLTGRVPIFGICLGHQLIGLALGAKTYKLKFGHHGGNHPVRHEASGRIEITAHNHNFAVDAAALPAEAIPTHVDLNDGTLEGLRHSSHPLYSVQYHPEAAPGPHDSHYLFADFARLMAEWKAGH